MPDHPELAPREWSVGGQRVVVADCLSGLVALPADSIDVCVTSPPYNIGVAYRTYRDRMPRAAYLDWLGKVGRAIHRVLKPDGSFFLNIGGTGGDPWIATDAGRAMGETFILQNHIIWVKSLSIGHDSVGHFKPINSPRYLNHNHEAIFHFTKTGAVAVDRLAVGVPFKDKSNIARWGHTRDRRCAGNVWFMPYQTVKSRREKFDHPAGFPVELPLRCIQLHGVESPRVLDPFLGAGTTLVAAQTLGAEGIGFEIDAAYAERAMQRLALAKPA
jgi:site-specific DNA-methyltransferase (adenine-specific)